MKDMQAVVKTIAEHYSHSREMLGEFRDKRKQDEHDKKMMYRFQVESALLSCLVMDLDIAEEVDEELKQIRKSGGCGSKGR